MAGAVKEATGLRTVFHHHCAGYVETPAEMDRLLSLTNPGLLGLVIDTGHYRFAGGDPVQTIHDHADRIWHLHFKDCEPHVAQRSRAEKWDYFESVNKGVFCELGQGEVDFAAVRSALEEIDLGDLSLFDLLGALRHVLVRYEREHPPPLHLPVESFSVRAQLERLLSALGGERPVDLVADLRGRSCRAEIVAAFLAVLELARLHLVRLHQTDAGELLLYRTTREVQQHELEAIQG